MFTSGDTIQHFRREVTNTLFLPSKNVTIGTECVEEEEKRVRGILGFMKKKAANSFQISLRELQSKLYGMVLVVHPKNKKQNGAMDRFNLRPFLPSRSSGDTGRKMGTLFDIQVNYSVVNVNDALKGKLREVFGWTSENDVDIGRVVGMLLKIRRGESTTTSVEARGNPKVMGGTGTVEGMVKHTNEGKEKGKGDGI